jgi:transposase
VRAFTLKARLKKEVAMTIATFGIDLGKSVFHLVGQDAQGRTVLRRRMTRQRLITLTATLPACRIGMEACCGAHYLGRILAGQGHDVRLMPAQYVRPFVKSHKNDYVDAEAIAEAVQRPSMHFVPLKSEAQLDQQALHRVRDRLVRRRTAVINQIRAFLLERGVTVAQRRRNLELALPRILARFCSCRLVCACCWPSCARNGVIWMAGLRL